MSTTLANTTTLTGSCFCGNVAYEITGVPVGPVDGIICHCRVRTPWFHPVTRTSTNAEMYVVRHQSCQKLHTMVSYNVAFGITQLKVTKGTPNVRSPMYIFQTHILIDLLDLADQKMGRPQCRFGLPDRAQLLR